MAIAVGGGFMVLHSSRNSSEGNLPDRGLRQRRPNSIRSRILMTAMGLFERQTVARTYVADIMRNENLTRELFYYYFADKESLVDSVIEAYQERCFEAIDVVTADAGASEESRLQAVVGTAMCLFFDEECDHTPMARVFDELGIFRDMVSATAGHGAMRVLGEDADPDELRELSVLLLAGIGLGGVSDPDREQAIGQAQRLIGRVLAR